MERRMKRLQICCLVMMMTIGIATPGILAAQDYVAPPVTISKDKVKIDGKVFYSHIVLERQTLFSISKAYGVSIDDIYKHNPSVEVNGLRKNDIIIIPVVEKEVKEAKEARETKEVKASPQKHETVTDGQIKYTVQWYDDLTTIAEKFNVSEESIIAANGLRSRKLKKRQVLIIPVSGIDSTEDREERITAEMAHEDVAAKQEVAENVSEPVQEEDSWEYYSDYQSDSDDWFRSYFRPEVNISLVLPFKANGKSGSRNSMDFYSGVLLAARELTDNNIDLNLNVVDIANDSIRYDIHAIKESDVIIGPLSPRDISNVLVSTGGMCPLVSPLDQRVESQITQCRNLIQVPTSQYVQFKDIADWIEEDLQTGDKVIVITEKGARQKDNGTALASAISASGIRFTPFSYSILEGRDIQHSLETQMTQTGVNRVVIASESEAFVNDAIRNLGLIIHNKFNVILYAPSKIRSFETIEVDNLHKASLHLTMSYSIDYESPAVRTFVARYRAMFGTEPTQFAFQGYDLTTYFTRIIAKYGRNWGSYLTHEKAELLQSSISFESKGNGNYTNNGTRRVIYDDGYSIIHLDSPAINSQVENGHSPQPEE